MHVFRQDPQCYGGNAAARITTVVIFLAFLIVITTQHATAQVNVLTHRNDNNRTGANLSETVLSTANVNSNRFGRIFTISVDGYVQAQPLYVSHVSIPARGTHNVLYIATEHSSVYAFDADTGDEIWHDPPIRDSASDAPPALIGKAISSMDIPACDRRTHYQEMGPEIGIAGTPVINLATKTLYCLSQSHSGSVIEPWSQTLHALDITTGAEKPDWPVKIPSVLMIPHESFRTFFLQYQNQRAALAFANNSIYVCWGSYADCFSNVGGYNGMVMRFGAGRSPIIPGVTRRRGHFASPISDSPSHGLQSIFCATPTHPMGMGGIWMSGSAPAIDAQGNVYLSTGNGQCDVNEPQPQNFSDSLLKLNGSTLTLTDYFTPSKYQDIEEGDFDLSSAGCLLIPGTSLMIGSAKDGKIYLVDTDDMKKYHPTGDRIIQEFQASDSSLNCRNADGTVNQMGDCNHIMNSPAFYNSSANGPTIFYSMAGESIKAYHLADGKCDLDPRSKTGPTHAETPTPAGYSSGAAMSISANGKKAGTGIVWGAMPLDNKIDPAWDAVPGVLRAYDASTLRELWNSESNSARDSLGLYAKFTPPTIANGKVYAPTFSNKVVVYGELPSSQ